MTRSTDGEDKFEPEEYEDISAEEEEELLPEEETKEVQAEEEIYDVESVIEEISGSTIVVRTMKGLSRFDIGKLFNIDQTNLSSEFANQASMYAFFAVLAANADKVLAMKTLLCDQEYATADGYHRNQMDLDGKKFTEAVVKSMVVRDEEYCKTLEDKENASYDLDIIKAVVRAFEQRAMMLQSLGSYLRHEYDMQGMNIRERNAELTAEKSVEDVKNAIERRRLAKKSE